MELRIGGIRLARAKIMVWTVGGAAAAIALVYFMGSIVGPTGSAVFSFYLLPLIFIFVAWIAATALRLEGWATVIGPNTTVHSSVRLVACAFALALGLKIGPQLVYGLVLYLLKPEAIREAVQTTKVAVFEWPGMTPSLFRSLVGSPISEELLVRGCLLSLYQRYEVSPFRVGRVVLDGPNVVSSIAFALFHLVNKGETGLELVLVSIISMFLGKARRTTGGLLAPMLSHSVFNFVAHTILRVVPI
jgi:membrane protease YdiL (CAAX protease family)